METKCITRGRSLCLKTGLWWGVVFLISVKHSTDINKTISPVKKTVNSKFFFCVNFVVLEANT